MDFFRLGATAWIPRATSLCTGVPYLRLPTQTVYRSLTRSGRGLAFAAERRSETLMTTTTPRRGSRAARAEIPAESFDDEGVRLAILAALEAVHECFPHITLPQYMITLEVRKAERDGKPHTLASIVKKLKIPFSTASRVVWSLTEEGGDIGIIKYLNHPTDRRKKLLVINERNEPNEIPRAISRAMLDYYGEAVKQLRGAT